MNQMDKLTRVKPVKEKINFDEKKDMPLYMRESPFKNIKGLESVKLRGVVDADKIRLNKTDYTQRGDKR